ncbi:hypothetical protein ACIRQO_38605 [Streptomyces anulatus]
MGDPVELLVLLVVVGVRHVGDVRGGSMTYAATAAGVEAAVCRQDTSGTFDPAPSSDRGKGCFPPNLLVLLVLLVVGQLGTVGAIDT